jgi:hypothetical protein
MTISSSANERKEKEEQAMTHFRRGLFAGLLAGLLLAMLNFVTDGTPGRTLPDALQGNQLTLPATNPL